MKTVCVVALLLILLPLAACNDATGADPDAHVGTYTLHAVNGSALPAVVLQLGDDRIEVVSGSMTLEANGTFASTMTLRTTEGGVAGAPAPVPTVGTYTKVGTTVSFVASTGEVVAGLIVGRDLTISSNGIVAVYRR